MNISLLLPTRGRPALVQRLFHSLVETTKQLDDLEVVLYIDADDRETQETFSPSLRISKVIGAPGQTMGKMNARCYEASSGRYVMLVNDDVIFRTRSWDLRVLESFDSFGDGIALVYGNDLDQGGAVPTFPIVSRVVCDVLGEICPSGYRNLHIESHLFDIFNQLGNLGHHRIRYLDDVLFEHMHYTLGKAAYDSTYRKKSQRADDLLFLALDDERTYKAKLLLRYIEAQGTHSS